MFYCIFRIKITRNSLIIDPVELTDTAIYHCHTSNYVGEKWFNITVKIKNGKILYFNIEGWHQDGQKLICLSEEDIIESLKSLPSNFFFNCNVTF
jgi:hypothetical protein